jgi:hypothetical protein
MLNFMLNRWILLDPAIIFLLSAVILSAVILLLSAKRQQLWRQSGRLWWKFIWLTRLWRWRRKWKWNDVVANIQQWFWRWLKKRWRKWTGRWLTRVWRWRV